MNWSRQEINLQILNVHPCWRNNSYCLTISDMFFRKSENDLFEMIVATEKDWKNWYEFTVYRITI